MGGSGAAALGAALLLLALYLTLRALPAGLAVPRLLLRLTADIYLWTALLAILGWGHARLNRPWRWLPWARASVYPWYVLHQTVIIALVVWLAPLRLGPWLEPALLLTGTLLACGALTAVVRRTAWLRPLFGLERSPDAAKLRPPGRLPRPSPGQPACR